MAEVTKNKKRVIALYFILRFFVISLMVLNIFERNYNNVFICVLTLFLFFIPAIIDRRFNIKLPTVLEGTIILFIFAAQILGEIQGFYLKFEHWDTILHTLNGFIMSAIGFAMIDILNQNPRLHFNVAPVFVAFVSFCFSMTIGVLWEFFEYFADVYAITDMQKDTLIPLISSVTLNTDNVNTAVVIENISKTVLDGTINGVNTSITINGGYLDTGLIDTMHDLIVNCIGAVCFSVIGFLYIKGRSKLATNFIPTMKTKEEIESEKNKFSRRNKNDEY